MALRYTFRPFMTFPFSLNDIHECKESLFSMQVSVSDPIVSHRNQPEFRAIAELGKR